jgi:hypothetical protein
LRNTSTDQGVSSRDQPVSLVGNPQTSERKLRLLKIAV